MTKILRDYEWVSLKNDELDGKLDFSQIFGRSSPVHVEIGSGKGTFLVTQSQALPEVNFLGIEWARRYYRLAVDRLGRWDLKNVRIISTDAASFIADFVPDNSVECFHIYFPDPWPKKRHHKRRFVNEANFAQLLRCLKQGGGIQVATDHADYFEQIANVVSAYKNKLEEVEFLRPAGAEDGELVGTNYERKYLKDSRQIFTIAVRKAIEKDG